MKLHAQTAERWSEAPPLPSPAPIKPRPYQAPPPEPASDPTHPGLAPPASWPRPQARKRKRLRLFRAGSGPGSASRIPSCGVQSRSGQFLAGAMSRNLRTALIFGGFISLVGAAFYPIYFRPLMRLEEYSE